MKQKDTHYLERNGFIATLAPRKNDAHKGLFGSVAIIGGDNSMVGAVLLSARAALLSGAGRVYAALLSADDPSVDPLHPEIMLRSPADLTTLTQLDCVVIGPGLGQSPLAIELLAFWLAKSMPMLIDADALNLLARHPALVAICKKRHVGTVITPHAGEAARLLEVSNEDIQQNRVERALKLAGAFHVTCVLKGAGSIIGHFDGSYFVNTTGNVGLASGGTGDVLSGIIGSLMAQGLSGLESAKLGVFVHGAAADALVARGIGPIGLTASEVAHETRHILNQLSQKTE